MKRELPLQSTLAGPAPAFASTPSPASLAGEESVDFLANTPFETPPEEGGSSGRTELGLLSLIFFPFVLRRPHLLGPSRSTVASLSTVSEGRGEGSNLSQCGDSTHPTPNRLPHPNPLPQLMWERGACLQGLPAGATASLILRRRGTISIRISSIELRDACSRAPLPHEVCNDHTL